MRYLRERCLGLKLTARASNVELPDSTDTAYGAYLVLAQETVAPRCASATVRFPLALAESGVL